MLDEGRKQESMERERGCCAGCGRRDKSLTAPYPNARDYAGPMYCLSCNPRFTGVGMVAALDRLA